MFTLRKSFSLIHPSHQLQCIKKYHQKNYYDLLQLSPKASQADVKKAYYKLSMQYHPDKSEGDETKFREITSAYEILGNIKLRRLYDQGLISHATNRNPTPGTEDIYEAPTQPESRFYRSKVPMSGKSKIYDFDEWSRMHYEKTRTRDWNARNKRQTAYRNTYQEYQQTKSEMFLFVTGFFFIAFIFATAFRFPDYDRPRRKPPRDAS